MLLELKNVDVTFSGVIQVLRSANLEVREGGIVALLGANGAGKTTTLRTISGLLETERGSVTAGQVIFDGEDITNADPCGIVADGIVQVLEGRRVLEHLTVAQNLRVGAHLRRNVDAEAEIARVLRYFPRLRDLMGRTSGYLSGGEMQMLLVGRALMAKPRLMLLDEPSMGLAPQIVKELFSTIQRINREEGVTMLLVEQNVKAALALADRAAVMSEGKVRIVAGSADLLNDERVAELYLGRRAGKQPVKEQA